jgi:UPF0755 protein
MRFAEIMPVSLREILFGAFLFVVAGVLSWHFRDSRLNDPAGITGEAGSVVFLYERTDLDGLIDHFMDAGVVFDEDWLRWAAGIFGWRNFLPGRYDLTGERSFDEVLRTFANGLQTPGNVTIHRGQWEERFIQRVAAQLRFTEEELYEALRDSAMLEKHNLQPHQVLGRMLPNTYEMYWTSTADQFVERMLSEFNRAAVQPYADRYEELKMNVDQITTMASIIEWEARYDHEMAKISGLYWNRLRNRWRLQADPTVNYALGERRRLFVRDYRVDHPYNTYRIFGLPPGPINNPSLSSIRAALFPEEHNYFFMVATPEGLHTFTRTYAEHQRESRKWQQFMREQTEIRRQQEREQELAREREKENENERQTSLTSD